MFEYHIAISFAGENRKVAFSLAKLLHDKHKLKVFYDDYEQAKMVGTYLPEYLTEIYTKKARYCVVLISKHYMESRWARLEWRAAQSKALSEIDTVYIIPIRIDNTEIPGLLNTVAYLSFKQLTIHRVARIIYDKVSNDVEKINTIWNAQKLYGISKFHEVLELLHDTRFDSEVEALRLRADAYGKLHEYKKAIKELKYILNFFPNDFLSHFLLGIFYYRLGKFKSSIKHYEIAEKISPYHPTIQSDLPMARKKLKALRNEKDSQLKKIKRTKKK